MLYTEPFITAVVAGLDMKNVLPAVICVYLVDLSDFSTTCSLSMLHLYVYEVQHLP